MSNLGFNDNSKHIQHSAGNLSHVYSVISEDMLHVCLKRRVLICYYKIPLDGVIKILFIQSPASTTNVSFERLRTSRNGSLTQ